MIDQLNKTGIRIQELINLFPNGWPNDSYPNLREHYRSLRLAEAWTLRAMLAINSEASFESEEEPLSVEDWNSKTLIEKIDFTLQAIDKIIEELPDYWEWHTKFVAEHIDSKCDVLGKDEFHAFYEENIDKIPNWGMEIASVEGNLIEAKMFLGFELMDSKK